MTIFHCKTQDALCAQPCWSVREGGILLGNVWDSVFRKCFHDGAVSVAAARRGAARGAPPAVRALPPGTTVTFRRLPAVAPRTFLWGMFAEEGK